MVRVLLHGGKLFLFETGRVHKRTRRKFLPYILRPMPLPFFEWKEKTRGESSDGIATGHGTGGEKNYTSEFRARNLAEASSLLCRSAA